MCNRERMLYMTMEERLQLAETRRAQGYNCCQAVILACSDLCGLPEDAASVGYCFGSGMQCGSVCGAVTGALMTLGSSMPKSEPNDNRPLARKAALELEKRFQERFGTLLCSDIVRDNGKRICGDCVAFCVESTTDIIDKINKGEL